MGRLVNPGPGEQLDRLTVLALKILHGTEAGKDVSHFERERAVLVTQVRARTTLDVEALVELAAVNAALWHSEDALRALREDPPTVRAAMIAFRIQSLNDRRAALVSEINARAGDSVGELEKL